MLQLFLPLSLPLSPRRCKSRSAAAQAEETAAIALSAAAAHKHLGIDEARQARRASFAVMQDGTPTDPSPGSPGNASQASQPTPGRQGGSFASAALAASAAAAMARRAGRTAHAPRVPPRLGGSLPPQRIVGFGPDGTPKFAPAARGEQGESLFAGSPAGMRSLARLEDDARSVQESPKRAASGVGLAALATATMPLRRLSVRLRLGRRASTTSGGSDSMASRGSAEGDAGGATPPDAAGGDDSAAGDDETAASVAHSVRGAGAQVRRRALSAAAAEGEDAV